MIDKFRIFLLKFFAFLLIASILAYGSYFFVYKVSFLPNGFDIEELQEDKVSLKSFNLAGSEKDLLTKTFSEDDSWMIYEIKYQVKRQKSSFWMLFSFTTISLILFIYKVRKGRKLWKAIFESNIIFSVLSPLVPLISTLDRLHILMS